MNRETPPRIITLTTDFGEGSPYVAEMKGVILGINPDVTLVDISHSIRPQDITHGALVLEQAAPGVSRRHDSHRGHRSGGGQLAANHFGGLTNTTSLLRTTG